MSCDTSTPILPRLRSAKQGAAFTFGIDWSCNLAEGETLSTADTVDERVPVEDATILGDTAIDETVTTIEIDIPDDAPLGAYHMKHTVVSSAGNRWVECFSIVVEGC
jgi:hypothetical protein